MNFPSLVKVFSGFRVGFKSMYDEPVIVIPNIESQQGKGPLISKCPYEKSVSSKIPTKKFTRFLP